MRVFGEAVKGSRLVGLKDFFGIDNWVWVRPDNGFYRCELSGADDIEVLPWEVKTWRGAYGQLLDSCPDDFRLAS